MMQERGVDVDPTTIMHWVHRYAPELEKRSAGTRGTGHCCINSKLGDQHTRSGVTSDGLTATGCSPKS